MALELTEIIIICGASALAVLILCVVLCCICKRGKRHDQRNETGEEGRPGAPPIHKTTNETTTDVFVSSSSRQLPDSLEVVEEGRPLPRPAYREANDEPNRLPLQEIPLNAISLPEIINIREANEDSNTHRPIPYYVPSTPSTPSTPSPRIQKRRLYDGKKILDLHHYYLGEAMDLTEEFLEEKTDVYISGGCRLEDQFVILITGRGLHSLNGVPVIRPNVENYLDDNDYDYKFVRNNSGRIRVNLAR